MNQDHPIIRTENLKKIYGSGEAQVNALDGITLTIQQGEFVAIMGPSGSGKSTLLNILACLDRPSEGRYFLDGIEVSQYSRRDLALIRGRKIGMVFQSYNLLPRLTALENVLLPIFYRREQRLSAEEARQRALAMLESVGLGDRAHHYPNQLSGGQQQRVAIARALVNDPALILADEPTGNLDSHASQEILELLQNLHAQGRTIVLVTHDPEVAARTERILLIRDGHLISDQSNDRRQPLVTPLASAQRTEPTVEAHHDR
ncbi:ABC transporter ATP-binding protein [uncultured Thermanaerothrix sp.]|uniref:ABC transporter ATP-binding protein n=1 Tax=uncultured Thermanaerothrix sp. TaxID=1195149 RepID=UPI0026387E9E|nr:ABC transporter ATP-binding protein [uncultured Thermanaerothrix sp.]